jgi:hypothetical protein
MVMAGIILMILLVACPLGYLFEKELDKAIKKMEG